MNKTYYLKPTMTLHTVTSLLDTHKPALGLLYPDKHSLKLGLDVHLEFIMAVAQRDHAAPQAPRKFTPEQLVLIGAGAHC
jgi:hypothetical protein